MILDGGRARAIFPPPDRTAWGRQGHPPGAPGSAPMAPRSPRHAEPGGSKGDGGGRI